MGLYALSSALTGQDDRSCVLRSFGRFWNWRTPEKTALCILTDKEEIGSEGVSGSQSTVFELFWRTCATARVLSSATAWRTSFCLSADVLLCL